MTASVRSYAIHEVAELTGLEPARLRAWERRYAAVRPERHDNGYRAYSVEQVALLQAYARLIAGGERIGDLVARPAEEVIARAEGRTIGESPYGALLDAVRGFDRDRLESLVAQQIMLRGLGGFAREVAVPFAASLGQLWALGQMTVSAEHLASEVVVHALKGGLRASRAGGPLVVAACLPGERHEWGILCALAVAQEAGWRPHYLGADLPVQDALETAWRLRPRLLALSASDRPVLERALTALSGLPGKLPPGVSAGLGGAGVIPYARLLRTFGYLIDVEAFTIGVEPVS